MSDRSSAAAPGTTAKVDLFAVSAVFLFLELAFIRWFPAQVLFLTFFTNTVLLASFLGLSLGCLAARRSRNFLVWTPILLVIALAAGAGMEWIRLSLQDMIDVGGNKASPQVVYFGAEAKISDVATFAIPIELVAGTFFLLIAATMIGVGQFLGRRFAALANPVEAYMINIVGSLVGVLLFQCFSWWLPPVLWFAFVAGGMIYFLWREGPGKWLPIGFAILAPLILLLPDYFSIGVIRQRFPEEYWSPYYRINYSPASRTIVVNLLGHQNMVSRKEQVPSYALPYMLNRDSGQKEFHDILVIGAGSGNDLSRAMQWAAKDAHIDAVEIDPVIQSLGARDHPDKPYQDPRITVHLGDGRNFLRSTDRKYDLVIFALIDSLVLHSSVSNIRLESYLFTRDSMADVRHRLKPDGIFVMYNYFRQGWIVSRLAKTVREAFEQEPLVLALPNQPEITMDQKAEGFTLLFAGPRADAIKNAFNSRHSYQLLSGIAPNPGSPNGFELPYEEGRIRLSPSKVEIPSDLRVAEDVWPFLYLRRPMIPDLSLRGIVVVAAISLVMLWLFGWRTRNTAMVSPHPAMFLLGAGFMLLETKAVVHMALIFGSTWIVNTVVFSAILLMILAANLLVLKRPPLSLTPFYIGLLATLALNVVVPLDSFLGLSQVVQGLAAGALVLSPVLCAGVIFATLFKTAEQPEQALAYNTAGAILGGLAESSSLLIGFKYLIVLAALIYAASWLVGGRKTLAARLL